MMESKIHKTRKRFCLLLTLLIFIVHSPSVYAAESGSEDEEQVLAPYFIIQSEDPSIDCFPLKATDVTANINGIIAEIYVTQTYTNEGDKPINARYVFPTSSDVVVHGMTMQIGDNIVTARIKEKEEAKAEYEEAKSEGKSTSLLEQKRPNVFTMDVANIMPGDTALIELYYTQMIPSSDGIYEFIFPTVVGPRYVAPGQFMDETAEQQNNSSEKHFTKRDDSWAANPYLADGETPPGEYHITVNLSTGVPISELTCKSHEINITEESDSKAQVTLANPEDYAGNRDFILKYKLTGEGVQSGLVLTKGESENFFMLTVQPPERYEPEEIPPREYIFVLDVSGSMYGYPLDTAKTLIRDLVTNLSEDDKFNLILFANDTYMLSPDSLSATTRNIKAATDLIDEQKGGGGTSMLPALTKAVDIPLDEDMARSIVVITDGYISNEMDILEFVEQHMDTSSFFCFGIGSSVNDYLIKGIAKTGLGESFVVTDSEDAKDSAQRFRTYIESPLLTNISVSYDGFNVYDAATATPSILYAQKPIVLFGKWNGEASGTITVSGKAGGEEYVEEIPVKDVTITEDNDAIRYLWARTTLDRITGYGSIRNDSSIKEEVTRLGLDYNMTTPYTSFIAVIETVRNTEEESTDVGQALPLPLHVTNLAVGGGYRAYSEPESVVIIMVIAGAALLRVVISILQRRDEWFLRKSKNPQP